MFWCIQHNSFIFGGTFSFKSSIIYWTFIKSHIHLGIFGMRRYANMLESHFFNVEYLNGCIMKWYLVQQFSGENRSEGDQSTETTNFPCNFQEIRIFFHSDSPEINYCIWVYTYPNYIFLLYIIRKEREHKLKNSFKQLHRAKGSWSDLITVPKKKYTKCS